MTKSPKDEKLKAEKPKTEKLGRGGHVAPRENRWKPGQSGNPSGRALESPALKKLRKLTKQEMENIGSCIVKGDVTALRKIKDNPKSTALQVMMASCCLRCIDKGEWLILDGFLNRLIGKVKEQVEHSTDADNPVQVVVTIPANGREAKDVKP